MPEYTKLTNLEVTGDLKVNGKSMEQGAAVADAAGAAPTAAEFKALLDSLRAAGIIATST
jgi:hypothetical protein